MGLKPGPRKRGESTEAVHRILRDKILSLELSPGQKIEEAGLAALCGVSRTPVREALFRLASEGLVVLLPNRVTQVAQLDLTTVHDYLEGIDLLQRAINRWAALRRKDEHLEPIRTTAAAFDRAAVRGELNFMVLTNRAFHSAIADAAGNGLIADAYRRVLDVGLRVSRFTLSRSAYPSVSEYEAFVGEIKGEHHMMIDAIERQNPDEAERLSVCHTARTRERFADYLTQSLARDVTVDDGLERPDPGDRAAWTSARGVAAVR
ncbi:MAG TPA: GntR family transcriptional regulator [Methylomirabilota bacterium]|nr:GntR family transcriptional regulator [Methylomirabilota bacterium]